MLKNLIRYPSILRLRNSKSKGANSRIPGVKKPSSVARTNNISRPEETKKHKGKTPSFGNTNPPLFLNNFQIDPTEIGSDNNTPNYIKKEKDEELKADKRTFSKTPSADLTDKFSAPILSHREPKKNPVKKTAKPLNRTRPLSKKASPKLANSTLVGPHTPKLQSSGKSQITFKFYRKWTKFR